MKEEANPTLPVIFFLFLQKVGPVKKAKISLRAVL